MKTLILGDIHGLAIWKKIINKEKPDKIIFVGDYVDSFHITVGAQLTNLLDIAALKNSRPTDVTLLMGNHDYHYLDAVNEQYSGFDDAGFLNFKPIMADLVSSRAIKIALIEDDLLFVHAGVTKTWCEQFSIDYNAPDVDRQINELLYTKPAAFKFNGYNPYGDDPTQSPLWVRPYSLEQDMIPKYTQVVGHTQQAEIKITEKLILIDALPSNKYLINNNGKLTTETL